MTRSQHLAAALCQAYRLMERRKHRTGRRRLFDAINEAFSYLQVTERF